MCVEAHKAGHSCCCPDGQPCSLDLAKMMPLWLNAGILLHLQASRPDGSYI